MTDQQLRNESRTDKYFSMMLHMADDDLGPHEYRLLGHYLRVCGSYGDNQCFESTRTTAEKTKMGVGTVHRARKELERLGYIIVTENSKRETLTITLVDRMAENTERYKSKAECSRVEQSVFQGGTVSVPQVNQRITKEEKQKRREEKSAPPPKKPNHTDMEPEEAIALMAAALKQPEDSKKVKDALYRWIPQFKASLIPAAAAVHEKRYAWKIEKGEYVSPPTIDQLLGYALEVIAEQNKAPTAKALEFDPDCPHKPQCENGRIWHVDDNGAWSEDCPHCSQLKAKKAG